MRINLSAKRALVVGGGTFGEGNGIGRAICLAFASCGAEVVVCDLDAAAATATAEMIAQAGGKSRIAVFDAGDGEAVSAALADVVAEGIDILQYNVGIGFATETQSLTPAQFSAVLNVNLVGLHAAVQAVLPGMRARKSGVILATSSTWAHRHLGYSHSFYAASKAGMDHFIRMLAQENARYGIRANSIAPGFIDTPRIRTNLARGLNDAEFEALLASRAASVPIGRLGLPEDVAQMAAFLASDLAGYVTGADFLVDGGLAGAAAIHR